MKIAIALGTFASGRDGVADYTDRLARECASLGNEVAIIALNDRGVNDLTSYRTDDYSVLRIPSKWPAGQRSCRVEGELDILRLEHIALQFVPYAYNRKGVVWSSLDAAVKRSGKERTSIMLHELWIGENLGAPFPQRLMGALQRICILRMIRRMAGTLLFTSNDVYVALLRRHGFDAVKLPLFGNMEIAPEANMDWAIPIFREHDLMLTAETRPKYTVFATFGSLHSGWSVEPLLECVARVASARRTKAIVAALGRPGGMEDEWRERIRSYPNCAFVSLGERKPFEISSSLQWADVGIATTPLALLGKSGSVAAMLEHGLPVIAARDDWQLRKGPTPRGKMDPFILSLNSDLETRLTAEIPRRPPRSTITEIARRWLEACGEHVS